MNNKGFAITTILYGTLILFLMLLLSMLSILSVYKDRLDILIESNNGARDIINNVVVEQSNFQLSTSDLEIYSMIGGVIHVTVELESNNWNNTSIKVCTMDISLENDVSSINSVTSPLDWDIVKTGNNYRISSNTEVAGDSSIILINVLNNGNDRLVVNNVKCSSDGSDFFDVAGFIVGIKVP